ncbi:MAG TPA: sigma-70 family RNA polymerase sigma factor [Terriglobia bacterium]|nr:sigma-70 family RNA polymerase sigma factor [Terriglobia bacterium]
MEKSEAQVAEEIQCIKRAQQGESEAFGPLVQKHQQRVFSLVYHLVRRRDEVEDLAQEIFIKAFRAIRSYNFQSSFATWLSRIATNHCYDYLRHERASRVSFYWQMGENSQQELETNAESKPEGGLDHEEQIVLKDLVSKLLDRAPEDDRNILVLKELQDYSVEEIAEVLHLKPTTVKVRLHRARKRMLEDLRRWREENKGHAM